jgi:hypothetical protein
MAAREPRKGAEVETSLIQELPMYPGGVAVLFGAIALVLITHAARVLIQEARARFDYIVKPLKGEK